MTCALFQVIWSLKFYSLLTNNLPFTSKMASMRLKGLFFIFFILDVDDSSTCFCVNKTKQNRTRQNKNRFRKKKKIREQQNKKGQQNSLVTHVTLP